MIPKNLINPKNPGSDILPIMEAFYTLQGESYHQGKAAYFIRLGGCDVGCVWCDVKESWDVNAHPLQSIEEIVLAKEAALKFHQHHYHNLIFELLLINPFP